MKLRKTNRPAKVEIDATDLDDLAQVVRDLNSLHGSQTCHVSREITRLENIAARMNPAPRPASGRCISCDDPTSTAALGKIGNLVGPICEDCEFWCDGNVVRASDVAAN